MAHASTGVIGGFDCHADTHTAVALDPLGRRLDTATFDATGDGYRQALGWLQSFGPVIAVGVESTGGYGAALARHLLEARVRVIEINQPHPHTRARRGKSDPIDAEAAARKVLSGEATGAAKDTTGIVEAIRQLTVAREGAVKARSAALCQLGDLIVTAPTQLREQLDPQNTLQAKASVCARLRPKGANIDDPTQAAKAALRSVGRRIKTLTVEIDELTGELDGLVAIAAPTTITQFGVEPDFVEGRGRRTKVKVSKVAALADDLALALAARSIRIEAPVPGKGFIGIEVPNTEIALVALRDVMDAKAFQKIDSKLAIGLGQDVSGHAISGDLASMPHLLIAGTTGSGKSVCVNAIISCLLLRNTPDELRLLMVDPKRVELTAYNGIPHLLAPVVVDLERVVPALQWVLREMDERYRLFAKEGVRHLTDYNQRMRSTNARPKEYLVVVIDELADLMMLAPDETERVVTRLAQLARATGIHLVIATQRPSVDVVTGLIKANFPARIAFAVASSVDSRVILDQPGAERLLGRGDMLFQAPDAPAPLRMQGAFVAEAELARLIRYWKNAALGGEATAPHPALQAERQSPGLPLKQASMWEEIEEEGEASDDLFEEAVAIVREMRRASISLLQRRLRIGYGRAARLVDQLEERGIVGPAVAGSQPREVLDYGSLQTVVEE